MADARREQAAKRALSDIRWLIHRDTGTGDEDTYLDGPTIVALLQKNFDRLDPNNDGITREELLIALMNPQAFTSDEYEMLRLLVKYFDTIINMSEDEEGEETKITRNDMMVLEQFLVHSKMTLKELHSWCQASQKPTPADEVGPPPMSSS